MHEPHGDDQASHTYTDKQGETQASTKIFNSFFMRSFRMWMKQWRVLWRSLISANMTDVMFYQFFSLRLSQLFLTSALRPVRQTRPSQDFYFQTDIVVFIVGRVCTLVRHFSSQKASFDLLGIHSSPRRKRQARTTTTTTTWRHYLLCTLYFVHVFSCLSFFPSCISQFFFFFSSSISVFIHLLRTHFYAW